MPRLTRVVVWAQWETRASIHRIRPHTTPVEQQGRARVSAWRISKKDQGEKLARTFECRAMYGPDATTAHPRLGLRRICAEDQTLSLTNIGAQPDRQH